MSSPLSKQLFHGTGEILKPGDMVEPRTEQVHIDRRLGLNTVSYTHLRAHET